MTREEAIEIVQQAFDEWENEFFVSGDNWDKEHEALDMAIEALKAEPCDDAISREAALMCMTGVNLLSKKPEELISLFDKRIKALPSATPKQKTGHWIKEFNDTEGEVRFTCSNCGKYQLFETDYCYHCGSDNRKGQK